MEVFLSSPRAIGLHLHLPKVPVVNDSTYPDLTSGDAFTIASARPRSQSLGSRGIWGPPLDLRRMTTSGTPAWGSTPTAALSYARRPPHLGTRMTRYSMYCLSVLLFLGQLAPPDARLLRLEAAAFASLLAARTNTITPVALSSICVVRSPLAARTASDAMRTAATPLALCSSILDALRDQVAQAADSDDALLQAPASPWFAACPLSFALRRRAQAHRLPAELVSHPRPESLVRRHFMSVEGPLRLRHWLRRRLTHLLQYPVADGEIELVTARLEWAFRDLPCSWHLLRFAS